MTVSRITPLGIDETGISVNRASVLPTTETVVFLHTPRLLVQGLDSGMHVPYVFVPYFHPGFPSAHSSKLGIPNPHM